MPDKIQWLPILTELGEGFVARLVESSPDIQAAILAARDEFKNAQSEGEALKKKGHENDQ